MFYNLKTKIAALEKEVAALKLERQTRIAQLQSYEQARLRVQDNPPVIVDLDSRDLQRKAKELLGVNVEVMQ